MGDPVQEYADMEHSGASLNDIQGQTTQTAFFFSHEFVNQTDQNYKP